MTEVLVIALCLVGLTAAALGLQAAWRAPRCGVCHAVSEALPTQRVETLPAVLEVAYRCPRCETIVSRRRFGEWD